MSITNCAICGAMNDPKWDTCCSCGEKLECAETQAWNASNNPVPPAVAEFVAGERQQLIAQVESLKSVLRTIMEAHRFNVSSISTTEVHALCFDALEGILTMPEPAIARVAELEAWKVEQIQVMSPVIEYARSVCNGPLGCSLSEWLVEDHKRLAALKAQPGGVVPDRDGLVAAVCVLRSQGLGNLSEAVADALTVLDSARLNQQPVSGGDDDEYIPQGIVQAIMQSDEVDAVGLTAKALSSGGVDERAALDGSIVEEVIEHMDCVWSGEADEDVTVELTRRLRDFARAALAQSERVPEDSKRLDFMLVDHRKVVVERLPHDNFEVYVEEGFMGDKRYPGVRYSGEWEPGQPEALDIQREAIDSAIAAAPSPSKQGGV